MRATWASHPRRSLVEPGDGSSLARGVPEQRRLAPRRDERLPRHVHLELHGLPRERAGVREVDHRARKVDEAVRAPLSSAAKVVLAGGHERGRECGADGLGTFSVEQTVDRDHAVEQG